MSSSWRKWQMLQDLVAVTVPPIIIFFVLRQYLGNRDTFRPNKEVSDRLETILDARDEEIEEDEEYDDQTSGYKASPGQHTRRRKAQDLVLNQYEQSIASEIVHPHDIPVSFSDIGGLDAIISDLQESVIFPLTMPSLYRSSSKLLSAPPGVLLYGPPGCGKTMLAKALAHESGAVFVNLHISTLTEKWYGDSNKLVAAVFSLARKLSPAIVFIDEVDAVLGSRRSGEHEASGMVKAEMMTHMDGLASADSGTGVPQRVLVLGATNRPQDIDEAILRRMPKRFAIGLPDAEQRRRILKLILRDTKLDKASFDLDSITKVTGGMSGSEIKETCRDAAMAPVREVIQTRRSLGQSIKAVKPKDIRGLRTEDFFHHAHSGIKDRSRMTTAQAEPDDDDPNGYVTTDEESEAEDSERKPLKDAGGRRTEKTSGPGIT